MYRDWDMLNEALKQMIAGDGKVNIINYPDEEDITIRLSPGSIVTGKQIGRASCRERVSSPV